jgi:putative transposase
VAFERACIFGQVHKGEMRLSRAGEIARDCWLRIPELVPWVRLDAWVVMPDHLHGIVHIYGPSLRTTHMWTGKGASNSSPLRETSSWPRGAASGSLGAIIAQYKGASGGHINKLIGTPGERVWHRDYYDHVIRHEASLERIRRYILLNPAKWGSSRRH